MTELINTSSEDTNQISWKKRFKSAFDNEHVFWTSLILWFIPIYIALPFLSSIIPSVEVIIVLIILFPLSLKKNSRYRMLSLFSVLFSKGLSMT